MSTSLLVLKVMAGASAVVGIAVVGSFGIASMTSTPSVPAVPPTIKTVIVKGTDLSGADNVQLTVDQQEINYKCKLSTAEASDAVKCKIFKLDTTKKWVDLTTIKATESTSPFSSSELLVSSNYFKIEVEESLYDAVSLAQPSTIDIISASNPATKHANAIALFKLDGETADYTKATHILGKATEPATSLTGSDSYCITTADANATGTGTACSVTTFNNHTAVTSPTQKYSEQTFSYSADAITSTTANAYYLMKWTAENAALAKSGLSTNTHAHITKTSATTWTTKATFSELAHVILDGADSNAVAFIMSTHTTEAS